MGFIISDKNISIVGLAVYKVGGLWESFVIVERDKDGKPIGFSAIIEGEIVKATSVEELALKIA